MPKFTRVAVRGDDYSESIFIDFDMTPQKVANTNSKFVRFGNNLTKIEESIIQKLIKGAGGERGAIEEAKQLLEQYKIKMSAIVRKKNFIDNFDVYPLGNGRSRMILKGSPASKLPKPSIWGHAAKGTGREYLDTAIKDVAEGQNLDHIKYRATMKPRYVSKTGKLYPGIGQDLKGFNTAVDDTLASLGNKRYFNQNIDNDAVVMVKKYFNSTRGAQALSAGIQKAADAVKKNPSAFLQRAGNAASPVTGKILAVAKPALGYLVRAVMVYQCASEIGGMIHKGRKNVSAEDITMAITNAVSFLFPPVYLAAQVGQAIGNNPEVQAAVKDFGYYLENTDKGEMKRQEEEAARSYALQTVSPASYKQYSEISNLASKYQQYMFKLFNYNLNNGVEINDALKSSKQTIINIMKRDKIPTEIQNSILVSLKDLYNRRKTEAFQLGKMGYQSMMEGAQGQTGYVQKRAVDFNKQYQIYANELNNRLKQARFVNPSHMPNDPIEKSRYITIRKQITNDIKRRVLQSAQQGKHTPEFNKWMQQNFR